MGKKGKKKAKGSATSIGQHEPSIQSSTAKPPKRLDAAFADDRFSDFVRNPKFKTSKIKKRGEDAEKPATQEDDRFAAVHSNPDFSLVPTAGPVDKRGKKTKKVKKPGRESPPPGSDSSKSNSDEDSGLESGGGLPQSKTPEDRIAYLTALSRGEVDVSSSDSDSDISDSGSDTSDDEDNVLEDFEAGEVSMLGCIASSWVSCPLGPLLNVGTRFFPPGLLTRDINLLRTPFFATGPLGAVRRPLRARFCPHRRRPRHASPRADEL